MINSENIRFLTALLLCLCTNAVYGEENSLLSCQSVHGAMSYLQPPRRVLIVPLLSGDTDTIGSKRWAEKPADRIEAFYRNRFNAYVRQMRDIWSWADYYQQAGQMLQRSPPFDRVIFIGHGGFDGPILNDKVLWQDFKITGANGKVLQYSEAQPGLRDVLSIDYNINKNHIFTDYMSAHWLELAQMAPNNIRHQLNGLEKQLQPLDQACFDRYCAPDKLAAARKETHESRIKLCEVVCREPLFELKSYVEISPEGLLLFTNSLSSLVTADGLIFFGACNPGSEAPEDVPRIGDARYLINTTLAGGPYQSYVHLISSATGRVTAGPIGDSSAEDIVKRIIRFESNNHQHFLCVVAP